MRANERFVHNRNKFMEGLKHFPRINATQYGFGGTHNKVPNPPFVRLHPKNGILWFNATAARTILKDWHHVEVFYHPEEECIVLQRVPERSDTSYAMVRSAKASHLALVLKLFIWEHDIDSLINRRGIGRMPVFLDEDDDNVLLIPVRPL